MRPKPGFTLELVPSDPNLPPGEFHPYRQVDPNERESRLIESILEILQDAPTPDLKGLDLPATESPHVASRGENPASTEEQAL